MYVRIIYAKTITGMKKETVIYKWDQQLKWERNCAKKKKKIQRITAFRIYFTDDNFGRVCWLSYRRKYMVNWSWKKPLKCPSKDLLIEVCFGNVRDLHDSFYFSILNKELRIIYSLRVQFFFCEKLHAISI